MFICESCYTAEYGTPWKIFRSYGRCEVCGETKPCLEKNPDRKIDNKEVNPK